MQLHLPTNFIFWSSVIIAVASVVVYIVHVFTQINYTGVTSYMLLFVAFVLLCLGLTVKL